MELLGQMEEWTKLILVIQMTLVKVLSFTSKSELDHK
jgi:hypothetical protein